MNYLLVSDIFRENTVCTCVYMTVGILITLCSCALKAATIFGTDSEVQFWISYMYHFFFLLGDQADITVNTLNNGVYSPFTICILIIL